MDNSSFEDSKIGVLFSCKFCAEKFLKEADLEMHTYLHSGTPEFCCPLCKQSFSLLSELKMHDLHHSINELGEDVDVLHDLNIFEEIFVCHICNKSFRHENELMNHSMSHLVAESSSDEGDDIVDGTTRHILYEISKCFAKYETSLTSCNIIYSKQPGSSATSEAQSQDVSFSEGHEKCSGNEEIVKDRQFLGNHCSKILFLTKSDEFQTFKNENETKLSSEYKMGHSSSSKLIKKNHFNTMSDRKPVNKNCCKICNKCFSKPFNLKRHFAKHIVHKPFSSDLCKKSFSEENDTVTKLSSDSTMGRSSPSGLVKKNHFKTTSDGKPVTKHRCKICNACFSKPCNLRSHFEKHFVRKPFSSDLSDKSFSKEDDSVKLSSQLLTTQTTYSCYLCRRKFSTKSFLDQHLSRVHNFKQLLKCRKCNMKFKNRIKLSQHKLIHKKLKVFVCAVCDKEYPRQYDLKRHAISHLDSRPFTCTMCKSAFKKKYHLKRHYLNVHKVESGEFNSVIEDQNQVAGKNDIGSKFSGNPSNDTKKVSCNVCKEPFWGFIFLEEHFHLAHKEFKMNECHLCSKQFKNVLAVRSHMLSAHASEKKFTCHICKKKYSSMKALSKHTKRHMSGKLYKCSVCDKRFSRIDMFRNHALQHEKTKSHCLECDTCTERFVTQKMLDQHILQFHNPDRKYVCKICFQRFGHAHHLTRHMNVHSEPKNINLSQPVSFKTDETVQDKSSSNHFSTKTPSPKLLSNNSARKNVKNHKLMCLEVRVKKELPTSNENSSDVPKTLCITTDNIIESKIDQVYTCNVCDRSFSRKSFLEKHKMFMHSAKKSKNECPLCGENFLEKFNLETHLLLHEEEKQLYSCKQCSSSFSRKSLLIRHIERKHALQ